MNTLYYIIKKIGIWAIIALLVTSCGLIQKVVVKEEIHHTYRDSLILNVKDSINVIPVERYVDIVPDYDTLNLQTSLAEAKAYIDTTKHQLKGEIRNKKEFQQKTHTEYVYLTSIDSIYIKEPVPYEVEKKVVPKWCWLNLIYSIILTVMIIIYLFKRFKILGF